jgi:hypothetical protein
MFPTINNFFTIRQEHRGEDIIKLTRNLQIAKMVTIATTAIFTIFAATSLIGLAPIKAALYLGSAYLSTELFFITTGIEKSIRRLFRGDDVAEVVRQAVGEAPFINLVVGIASPLTPTEEATTRRAHHQVPLDTTDQAHHRTEIHLFDSDEVNPKHRYPYNPQASSSNDLTGASNRPF